MKVKFLTTLDIRDIDNHFWQLLSPFVVEIEGGLINVPTGFITDFASVPRLPITYMLFGNIGHRAAVVHDYLYSTGETSREYADEVFKLLLIKEGVGSLRANIMYAGVRIAGNAFYNNQ